MSRYSEYKSKEKKKSREKVKNVFGYVNSRSSE